MINKNDATFPKVYPWYSLAEGMDLQQGDFITDCPIVIPRNILKEGKSAEIEITICNVIILSQSCDLEQKNISIVLVSPYTTLTDFGKRNNYYAGNQGKEALRRGYSFGYHLLNRCDTKGFETDYLVVDFRNTYGAPLKTLTGLIKNRRKRLRLLPPYKEHLSQAFARFFMRVGLPTDIPSFA